MGFRYRKSIQLMPGLRMNISHQGIGYSAGVRGARVSVSPSGRVTRTLSLPGTGISHVTTLSPGRSGHPARSRPAPAPGPPLESPRPPHPGLFAPSWEKDLYRAVADLDLGHVDTLSAVARAHGRSQPDVPVLCATLEGLWYVENNGDPGRARELLAWSVAHGGLHLGRHPFVTAYLRGRTWPVEIANGVGAALTLEQDVAALAVAELHQRAGDLAAAIWTVEQVDPPSTAAALSLAELYSDSGRHADVVDLTNGVTNGDDATALLLVLRGRAFSQTGYHDAARECLKEALRSRSRSPQVRHRALLERATLNLAQHRRAAARKDVETVLAEDPHYPGLAEALAALPA